MKKEHVVLTMQLSAGIHSAKAIGTVTVPLSRGDRTIVRELLEKAAAEFASKIKRGSRS